MRKISRAGFVLACIFFAAPFISRAADLRGKEPVFVRSDALWELGRFGSLEAYRDFLLRQGYDGVDLEAMDAEGRCYFRSPVLRKLDWQEQDDLLKKFLDLRKQAGATPLARKLKVSVHLSVLARGMGRLSGRPASGARPPGAEEFSTWLLDLQEKYAFSEFTSEPFPQDLQALLYANVNAARTRLNMLAYSPLIEPYLSLSAFYDKDFFKAPDRFVVCDYYAYPLDPETEAGPPGIGAGDVLYALARTIGREAWAATQPGAGFPARFEHNLFLYRTMQYAPEGFYLQSPPGNAWGTDEKTFDLGRDLKKDILEFYPGRDADKSAAKPVANLVLGAQAEPDLYLYQFAEPVMQALLANGYDVRVTFGRFLAGGADLYYVVNGADWLGNLPFFRDLLELLDYRRSRFYGTVILHPLGEIKNSGPWKKIRERFKIPDTEKGWVETMPEHVTAGKQKTLWRGTVPAAPFGMTFLRSGKVTDAGGEVLLDQLSESETYALILKSGSHYLVNGNHLHLEAGYFLSRLMGGALRSAAPVYVTSGKNRTAAWAVARTRLSLKLPAYEPAREWRVVRFDREGRRISDRTEKGRAVFEADLEPWELVILESRNAPELP